MTTEATAPEGTGITTAAPETGTTATAQTTTTTPAAAAPAADATLLTGDAQEKPVAAPADWPSDWREKLAGGDEKALAQLKRLNAPTDLWGKARSLEQKLSSGEYKKVAPPPGADAKPEELAAWRKENGIPEKPEDYKIELPQGLAIGEADKPLVDAFIKSVHEKGWDNAKANEALSWYYAEQDRQVAARAEQDAVIKQKAEDELRTEWGAEYRSQINAVKNLVAGMPEGVADNLLGGRLANGALIGDNAATIRWLAQISRELNPVATLLPAGGSEQGLTNRLTEIRKFRQENPDKYDADKGMQAEELRLLEAQNKINRRSGQAA